MTMAYHKINSTELFSSATIVPQNIPKSSQNLMRMGCLFKFRRRRGYFLLEGSLILRCQRRFMAISQGREGKRSGRERGALIRRFTVRTMLLNESAWQGICTNFRDLPSQFQKARTQNLEKEMTKQ